MLADLVEEIRNAEALDPPTLERILRNHPRDGKGIYSRAEIIRGFRSIAPAKGWQTEESHFVAKLRMRPVRTLSGVTPVTVLTKPFPCPGRCIFCPSDVRMPKSYLSDEPGAQRAELNGFDPYLQTRSRLATYFAIGHPVEKVELIVLGGTWSFYPEPYRIWFIRRCFDALNDFETEVAENPRLSSDTGKRSHAHAPGDSYNDRVLKRLRELHGGDLLAREERSTWEALERAQRRNETARCRCVGLSLETRPDCVSPKEVLRLRRLGATKVQLGIQSLSDAVLDRNRRGHDVAASREAIALLRGAGFKLQLHWMPNLAGATARSDVEDFARLFDDRDFRPDELKIYPCSLIEGTELMERFREGSWRPYRHAELLEVMTEALRRVPEYCRVTRVVRDISSHDIVAGNKLTNFRQIAEDALRQRGESIREIRSREVRGDGFDAGPLHLDERRYATSIGVEVFLQWLTADGRLAGFARLALPSRAPCIHELEGSAILREVHVYGETLPLGERRHRGAQHRGLGRRLIERAAALAREAGFDSMAVISAVGTRRYYAALGFGRGALYQHLSLDAEAEPSSPRRKNDTSSCSSTA